MSGDRKSGGKEGETIAHKQRGKEREREVWEPKRRKTEIVTKRERKSYSGNDVVAMEMLCSARLLHKCLVGIVEAIF